MLQVQQRSYAFNSNVGVNALNDYRDFNSTIVFGCWIPGFESHSLRCC